MNMRMVEEVSQKFGQNNNIQEEEEKVQKVIFRPVSGKSNSTRYQIPSAQSGRRNIVAQKQQQMFYDEESEDNHEPHR